MANDRLLDLKGLTTVLNGVPVFIGEVSVGIGDQDAFDSIDPSTTYLVQAQEDGGYIKFYNNATGTPVSASNGLYLAPYQSIVVVTNRDIDKLGIAASSTSGVTIRLFKLI